MQHPTLQRLWLDSFNYTEIVSITLFCEALRAYVTDMDADVLRRAVDVDGDGMVSA